MTNYNFDEWIDRSGTHSLKYEAGATVNPFLPEEHIPLWVADMDFAVAPPILAAMRKRLDRRILGYSILGDDCKESVSRWMQRRFGWTVSPETVVFSAGVVAALYAAVEQLTKPGEAVCFLTPAYQPFNAAVRRQNRQAIYSRMQEQDGYWTIDFDDLERQLSRSDCTMFLHCNPQNPTGRVFTRDELLRLGELCRKYDVFLVSDEIHADLTRVGQAHLPIAMLFPDAKNILTCTSPSKTFNIAGNNHAHIIVPDARIRAVVSYSAYCGHPGALSIDACMAAYDESEDWLEELRTYLDGNFAMMRALLADKLPKAVFRVPEGTYLAFVDLRAYCSDEQALKERISRAGVFVQFGEDFVDNGNCHMRVNAACPRSVLKEGLNRICAALQDT